MQSHYIILCKYSIIWLFFNGLICKLRYNNTQLFLFVFLQNPLTFNVFWVPVQYTWNYLNISFMLLTNTIYKKYSRKVIIIIMTRETSRAAIYFEIYNWNKTFRPVIPRCRVSVSMRMMSLLHLGHLTSG